MPYDPQRSHRRPRLADDAPAPIDALLGSGSEDGANGDDGPPEASAIAEPALDETASQVPPARDDAPASWPTSPDVEPPAPSSRARSPLAAAAVALLVVVLVVAWLRHRRR